LIYATEIPTRFFAWTEGSRLVGLFQFVTGIGLMYCTYAMTIDVSLGAKAWIQSRTLPINPSGRGTVTKPEN
jgi:hypothetical protein